MGNTFGRQVIAGGTGRPVMLSVDGKPEWKAVGITFDWTTVTAAASDTTLADGTPILAGEKYLEVGTPVTTIKTAEIQTVDLSGGDDPNGGTWTPTVPGYGATAAQAWNVAAGDLAAALTALVGAPVTVSKTGFVYTITFPPGIGNVAAITTTNTLTTAASTITITVGTSTQGIAAGGKYGPVDTSATDGRQTMANGDTFLLNQTVKQNELHSDHFPVIIGGYVRSVLLKVGGTNQATLANLLAAMPRIVLFKE